MRVILPQCPTYSLFNVQSLFPSRCGSYLGCSEKLGAYHGDSDHEPIWAHLLFDVKNDTIRVFPIKEAPRETKSIAGMPE